MDAIYRDVVATSYFTTICASNDLNIESEFLKKVKNFEDIARYIYVYMYIRSSAYAIS